MGEVSARFGQGKRGYASDKRSQTDRKREDRWTNRLTNGQADQSR